MSRDIGDITAERLSNDPGLQLLQNTVATAGVLVTLILALGPASGAHFNPAVTLVDPFFGRLDTPSPRLRRRPGGGRHRGSRHRQPHVPPAGRHVSTTERSAGYLWFAEGVATYGCCW